MVATEGHSCPRVLHSAAEKMMAPNGGCPQDFQVKEDKAAGRWAHPVLFRRGSEASQLPFVQSFPVFKVVVKVLH